VNENFFFTDVNFALRA